MNTEDDEFNRIERKAALRKAAVKATITKREWIGLTGEQRTQAEEGCWYMGEFDNTIYAMNIEAKLKEINEM